MQYFSALFGKELYMFRKVLLSIIRSLNTVITAIGIFHTRYVALCISLDFIIRIYHDALSSECQIHNSGVCVDLGTYCFMSCVDLFCRNLINKMVIFQHFNNYFKLKGAGLQYYWLKCTCSILGNIVDTKYIQ